MIDAPLTDVYCGCFTSKRISRNFENSNYTATFEFSINSFVSNKHRLHPTKLFILSFVPSMKILSHCLELQPLACRLDSYQTLLSRTRRIGSKTTGSTSNYFTVQQCSPNLFARGPLLASENDHGSSSNPCSVKWMCLHDIYPKSIIYTSERILDSYEYITEAYTTMHCMI